MILLNIQTSPRGSKSISIGDFIVHSALDNIASTIKARQHGSAAVVSPMCSMCE
jgi:hypothetical protein